MALAAMNDAFTSMAEGRLQGRWAFPLATGTGKTSGITNWTAAVHAQGLPYSLLVSASRIEALCSLKRTMVAAGIPEQKIGLIYAEPSKDTKYSEPRTLDNEQRQFLLCSHQLIRSRESNLDIYNNYQGQPRSLVIYDESLLVSDIEHFKVEHLLQSIGGWIERLWMLQQDSPERTLHAEILEWLHERRACIKEIVMVFDPATTNEIPPAFTLTDHQLSHYEHLFRKTDSVMADFLMVSMFPLVMTKYNKAAVITYRVVIPEALQNMIVLDASYPIRTLEQKDLGLQNAETLPVCVQHTIKFAELKTYERVTLYRMEKRGSRTAAVQDNTRLRNLMKDTVEGIKGIPKGDGILVFIYKQKDKRDPHKVLTSALSEANLDTRKDLYIQTWGNETSLNDYRHCKHVILVGILHRDLAELEAQLRGQTNDRTGRIELAQLKEICLSERAHCAYQALSRGACRNIDNGQAHAMTGYIVEFDPGLETELNKVMPGVTWKEWKPVFSDLAEHGKATRDIVTRLQGHLEGIPEGHKIASQRLRTETDCKALDRKLWERAVDLFIQENPQWKRVDKSLEKMRHSHIYEAEKRCDMSIPA